MCVTPADLGKPIPAIVQRCGAPMSLESVAGRNQMLYMDEDSRSVQLIFDADQMRARVLVFADPPLGGSPDWALQLPFASGDRTIEFGHITQAEAQTDFASDADVTTDEGQAYSGARNSDIILAFGSTGFGTGLMEIIVGERATLMQMGVIKRAIDVPPLDIASPSSDQPLLNNSNTGTQSTICRVDVDKDGIVRNVTIVVPSSDPSFDESLKSKIRDVRFHPATLDKRRVFGTTFVQVRHS